MGLRNRRLLVTLLVSALVLTSCSTAASQAPGGGTAATPVASGVKGTIGVSFAAFDSSYYAVVERNIQSQAQAVGMTALPTLNAAFDVAKQATDIRNLITQKVDALVFQPIDTAAIVSSLDLAAQANIPVVAFDAIPDAGTVYVTVRSDNVLMGRLACEQLGPLVGGKGKVVEIQGDFAQNTARERADGFEKCLKEKFSAIELLTVSAFWQPDKAAAGLDAILTAHPDLAGIYLHTDGGYLAAVLQTLTRRGKLIPSGTPGHIVLVSIDGEPIAHDAIRAGTMDATMSVRTDLYGKLSVDYVVKALQGVKLNPGPTDHNSTIVLQPSGILDDLLPPTVVTKANVDDPQLWGNAKT